MEQQMALLIQAFNLTILSNNTQDIKKGEQLLEQYQVQEGYIQALMLLVNRKQEPLLVRQAAVVNLTSLIDNSWRHTLLSKAKLSDNDRNAIKNNILEALIQSVDEAKISINYEKIINKIANYDYPQQWPHITENILLNIQESKTFQHLHGSILAVKNIVQVYQFYVGEDRDNLNKIIVPRLIPLLLETIQKIIPIANDQTINTIEQILKIYYSISHLDLPVDMQGDQSLDGWMTIFKTFIDKPIPQPLTIKTIDQDEIHSRQKNINWKIQKQCCRIVQRFIQKYANPKSDYKQVSARFQDLYILHFLESFILILNNSVKNYVAPKVTIAALKCVFYCIQQKQIFEKLNPHLENILYEICIPLTYLTPHDEDQWKNDPQEYVRREEDFMPTVKTCSMQKFFILILY